MAIEHKDGIIQTDPLADLYLLSKGGSRMIVGVDKQLKLEHEGLSPVAAILDPLYFQVNKNTDLIGHVTCASFLGPPAKTFHAGNNWHNTMNPSCEGLINIRTYNAVEVTVLSGEAPDKIYIDGDPVALGIVVDQLIYIKGSYFLDGIWEVSSLGANYIIIKQIPTHVSPVINNAVTTGNCPGFPHSKLSFINPGFIQFNYSSDIWEFGYFEQVISPSMRKALKFIGNSGDNTDDYSDKYPNIFSKGSNATKSGAKQVGLYTSGFTTITADNVQDAFGQIDGSLGTKGAPAFVFGEANVQGAANQYAPVNSQVAIFRNIAPVDINAADTGAKGAATNAARDDHRHGVPVGDPLDIGVANAEGSSTDLVRHALGFVL